MDDAGNSIEVLERVQEYYTDLFRKGEEDEESMKDVLGNIDKKTG